MNAAATSVAPPGSQSSATVGGTGASTGAPGSTAKTDEKVSQHSKRAFIVVSIFIALVLCGLLADSIFNVRKPVDSGKTEAPVAKAAGGDPFADFEAKQRDEMARLDAERRKKARQQGISPDVPASAPPRTPEQELRELARLEDLKRALGAVRSADMITTSARRNEGRAGADGVSGAGSSSASNSSQAETTLAQLKQAISRARAGNGGGGGGGDGGGGGANATRPGDELAGAYSRDLQGSDASGAVVGQAATARRTSGEGQRRGELLLPVGSVLSAVLDMEVSSDWEGRWRAMLTRDVYDVTQEYILLPKGTRILGSTTKIKPVNEAINQRMALAARWAVLPNGARIDLSRTGTLDQSGVGAIEGDVNRHILAQIGGVAAYGVLGGAGAVAAARAAGTTDPTQIALGATAGAEIAGGLVDIGKRVASRYLSLVPTITVKPGTTMTIFLDDELYLLPWAPVNDSFSPASSSSRHTAR